MVELACLTHIRTWRWLLGLLIRECSVGKTQDQCPLQLSGTIHKANWCRGTTGMKWITKLLLVVVELQYLPSKATNKARVESTSAEWMFQGTTWRVCLFALVSAARASIITLLLWQCAHRTLVNRVRLFRSHWHTDPGRDDPVCHRVYHLYKLWLEYKYLSLNVYII